MSEPMPPSLNRQRLMDQQNSVRELLTKVRLRGARGAMSFTDPTWVLRSKRPIGELEHLRAWAAENLVVFEANELEESYPELGRELRELHARAKHHLSTLTPSHDLLNDLPFYLSAMAGWESSYSLEASEIAFDAVYGELSLEGAVTRFDRIVKELEVSELAVRLHPELMLEIKTVVTQLDFAVTLDSAAKGHNE
jgi:hypothetical protein